MMSASDSVAMATNIGFLNQFILSQTMEINGLYWRTVLEEQIYYHRYRKYLPLV